MSRFTTLLVLGGLLCPFAGVSAQTAATAAAADPLALTGGTLVDGTGAPPLADAVVLIEDGRIACAGTEADCDVPPDVEQMDVTGRWVTPGLIDSHVHVTQNGWVDTRPQIVDVTDEYPWAEVQARNRWQPETYFRPFLCSGTTAVYDVGGFNWIWSLRRPAETDPFAPHLAATGPLIAARKPGGLTALPGDEQFLVLDSPEVAREIVRYMAANRADGMKLYYNDMPLQSPEARQNFHDSIFVLVEEARRADLPVVSHALMLDSAKLVMRAGVSMLVHSVVDQPLDDEFIELATSNQVFYTPTLVVPGGYPRFARAIAEGTAPEIDDPNQCVPSELLEKIASTPDLVDRLDREHQFHPDNSGMLQARVARGAEVRAANLKRASDAGVPIVMGTDVGNPLTLVGAAVYAEMEAMQAAGLTPMQVLVASTRNGARAMRRDDDLGTVEEGKVADLLVIRADPTEDIANMRQLETVIRAGHAHSQASLRAAR